MKIAYHFLPLLLTLLSPIVLSQKIDQTKQIRFNQVGYYPDEIKEFVAADVEEGSFLVVDEQGQKVFKGTLVDRGVWLASGEKVMMGDFSKLKKPGTYAIVLGSGASSALFEIKEGLYREALDASIKSFYFQRASMAIEEAYGGVYKRAAGHPDMDLTFHPSTSKQGRSLDAPGGWYDAGDYGKYVINAAITTGQMLSLLELYPDAIPDGRLNIPESENGSSDLLDEIRYELDWVATMQDSDGGVFHKLTAKNFGGFILPEDYELERLIIGKGTAASLTFAAVMAQASRVFKDTDPLWAGKILASAQDAWKWSLEHPDEAFKNPKDVFTGQYDDVQFSDDFYWAAAELYISTGDAPYLNYLIENEEPYIHRETNSWKYFIRNMGFHSILVNRNQVDPELSVPLVKKHIELSDRILQKISSIPYHVGVDQFEWGSNSDVINQAMILCIAHHLTGEQDYLDGSIRNMDYIFGKNATAFSFMTGVGSKQVMHPHHRPSGADNIEAPVPGFILGGPNRDKQDRQYVTYAHDEPARAFEDVQESFASNEVCLNWNGPAVFVLGYLEQVIQ